MRSVMFPGYAGGSTACLAGMPRHRVACLLPFVRARIGRLIKKLELGKEFSAEPDAVNQLTDERGRQPRRPVPVGPIGLIHNQRRVFLVLRRVQLRWFRAASTRARAASQRI